MKILRCHIEKFGCLSAYDVSFNDGLNVSLEENGWGKSTMAVFIKAMLYGLSSKSRDLNQNERKKYSPWDGGSFGGNMDFEAGGKRYRLERYFGATERKDTFALFDMDTGKPSGDYGENLGFDLLGIDSEAFERSIYISQRIIPMGTDNQSINAKLNGLVKDEDDIRSFNQACTKLDNRRKYYSTSGGRGAIGDAEKQLSAVLREIDVIKNKASIASDKKSQIAQLQTNVARLDSELLKLREDIEAGAAIESKATLVSHYRALCEKRDSLKAELEEFGDLYTAPLPDLDGLMDINNDMLMEIASADSAMPETADIEKLKTLRARAEASPSPEQAHEYVSSLDRLDELKDKASALQADKEREEAANWKKTGVLLPCALVILCIGIGLFAVLHNKLPFIIGLVLAVILLAVWFAKKGGNTHSAYDAQLEELQKQAEQLSDELSGFADRYGIQQGREGISSVLKLSDAGREYAEFKDEINRRNMNAGGYRDRASELNSRIKDGLGPFCQEHLRDYSKLIMIIKEESSRFSAASEAYALASDEAESFYKEKDIEQCEADLAGTVPLEQLRGREAALLRERETATGRIAAENRDIELLNEAIEQLPDKLSRQEALTESLGEYRHSLDIIQKTRQYLEDAQVSLSSRYMDEMRKYFSKYLRLFTGSGEGYELDSSMDVKVDSSGMLRSYDYLSRGFKDLINLCTRFALADALFSEEERPFFILDDPFVNLDEKKLTAALALLNKVADSHQIIYFSCHRSRT